MSRVLPFVPMPPRRNVGGLVFDERSGRYRNARGVFVSRVAVRAAIDAALKNAESRAMALGEQLRARQITRVVWHSEMQRVVKTVHIYSATAAKGGFEQLTQSDYGRVGQAVRRQYRYLEKFSADIKRGLALDGRMAQRSRLYASAGRTIFETTRRNEQLRRGYVEAISVLHPAEHCDVCVSEAEAGWRDAALIIPPGQRTCRSNCRCTLRYRNPVTGERSAA